MIFVRKKEDEKLSGSNGGGEYFGIDSAGKPVNTGKLRKITIN